MTCWTMLRCSETERSSSAYAVAAAVEVVVGEGRDVGEAGVGEQRLDVPTVRLGPRGLHRVVTPAARGRAERVVGEDPRELVDERRTLLALGGGRSTSLLEPDDVHARVQESAQVGEVGLLLRRVVALGPGVVHRAASPGRRGRRGRARGRGVGDRPAGTRSWLHMVRARRRPLSRGRRVGASRGACGACAGRHGHGPHPNVGTVIARWSRTPASQAGSTLPPLTTATVLRARSLGGQGEPSRGRDGPARLAGHADGVQSAGWRRRWRPRRR